MKPPARYSTLLTHQSDLHQKCQTNLDGEFVPQMICPEAKARLCIFHGGIENILSLSSKGLDTWRTV